MPSDNRKSNWSLERQGIQHYSIRLLEGSNKIGRIPNCNIVMSASTYISRVHCEINVDTVQVQLVDHSSNGTYVNQELVKSQSKNLFGNDKIGFGVDVSDDQLSEVQYHVYILRKVINVPEINIRRIIMCPPVVVVDSDSEHEDLNINEPSCSKTIKPSCSKAVQSNKEIDISSNPIESRRLTTEHKNADKAAEEKTKIKIISDVLISKPVALNESSPEIVDIFEELNDISISSDGKQTVNENVEIKNKLDIEGKTENSIKAVEETCTRLLPFAFAIQKCHQNKEKEKEIYTIDITSEDESNQISSKSINKNSSIVISDDEDFECSQFIILDIKQEINDFDCEDIINNKISNLNDDNDLDKHEKLSSPVYDLVSNDNDDEIEEEFDENLANWYMKLSQGIAVKQELEEEEKAFYENRYKKPEEQKEKLLYNSELDLSHKLELEVPEEKLPNKPELDPPEEKLRDKQELDHQKSVQSTHCDRSSNLVTHKINKKEINKVPKIIDAPRLPVHKGKLRGVSADLKTKLNLFEKKTLSLLKQDKKSNHVNDLKERWLSKPNAAKEKEKLKKHHDDRKEKLKIIADKETQKRKLCESKEIKVLKVPKVKITNKNRGAFLTEISSDSSSARVSKSVTAKRKNSDVEDRPKLNKIAKLEAKSSLTRTRTENHSVNKQYDKSTSNSHQQDKCPSTVKQPESFLNKTNASKENIEKRPEKLTFKSLKMPHSSNKPSTLPNIKPIKSILITKPKSDRLRVAKKVRFVEKPLISVYEHEVITTPKKIQKDATFDLTLLSERRKLRLRTFSLIDHTDFILSQILSWNPDWLESGCEEVGCAEVNGPNVLMPIIHHFRSLSEYENTIFPLLKIEMWVELYRNYMEGSFNKFATFTLNEFRTDDNNKIKKFIFKCQYSVLKHQSPNIFSMGDFILIQIKSYKIFGYIRDYTFISNTNTPFYIVTIESNFNEKLLPILSTIKTINVKKLSSITVELGQCNAVKSLKYSPLLKDILNPMHLLKKNSISIDNIKYEGYHKLNKIQEDVLLRTYLKCINPTEPNITLIEGPPGTGKSRVVANLALQILYGREVRRLDRRILICAPSNAAIDVITLQLIHIRKKMTNEQARFNLVRFGVVERMHPDVKMYSVRGLIDYNRRTDKINRRGLEVEKIFIEGKIKILKQNNNQNTVDQDELHNLKQDLNRINCLLNPDNNNYESDKILYPKFLAGANIICSTLSSCVKLLKYLRFFDVCIIDESTQCIEPWSLIPLQFTINSLVLIGDTQQLPATVLSKQAKECKYGKSLFTRISECFENNLTNNPIMTLRTQYRMHPEICRWPNSYFYKNKLINDSLVTQYMLKLKPYSIFNLDYKQNKTTEDGNISNTLEARFVIELIKHLKEFMPFEQYKYGIISPYAQHRDNLQKQLKESKISEIVASTIDSYQGNEKDVVIISNGRTEGVGFLFDVSRLNVSLTRAKKCLILCGSFSNINEIPAWKSLLNDAKSRNIYYNLTKNDIVNFKENVITKIIK